MENNFNLKKFLIENKLTSNSRQLAEQDFAPSPNAHLDVVAGEYPVKEAFRKAGINLSKPVYVVDLGSLPNNLEDGQHDSVALLKYLEELRSDYVTSYEEDPSEFDNDFPISYEYENYTTFPEDIPDGLEYKLNINIHHETDVTIVQ